MIVWRKIKSSWLANNIPAAHKILSRTKIAFNRIEWFIHFKKNFYEKIFYFLLFLATTWIRCWTWKIKIWKWFKENANYSWSFKRTSNNKIFHSWKIQLEYSFVDLDYLIKKTLKLCQHAASQKQLSIKSNIYYDPKLIIPINSNIQVSVDETRIQQILLNLLSNAVKFTEDGGVSIGLTVIEQTEKKVRIRFAVTDTGIGIANNNIFFFWILSLHQIKKNSCYFIQFIFLQI